MGGVSLVGGVSQAGGMSKAGPLSQAASQSQAAAMTKQGARVGACCLTYRILGNDAQVMHVTTRAVSVEYDQLVLELVQRHQLVQEAKIKKPKEVGFSNFAELPVFQISARSDNAKAVFRLLTDGRTDGRTHTRLVVFEFYLNM